MTKRFYRTSAKIYEFPKTARSNVDDHRGKVAPADDLTSLEICEAASGCWYHDEAIRESRPTARPGSKPI